MSAMSVTADVSCINFVHCSSEEFDIGSNHVDLVVSETLDSIGIGEGIVRTCRDLASRSLNKSIQFIPSEVTLQGFLIHSQTLHLGSFCGHFRTNIGSSEEPYCCEFIDEYTDIVQLSNPAYIFKVKLGNTFDKAVSIMSVPVLTDGWCDGVCSFFTAQLDKNTSITTAPSFLKTVHSRMECWEQGFHPLPRRQVSAGQVVNIKVELTEVSVLLSWVADQDQCTVVEPTQVKLLNSKFARSLSNELLNIVPQVLDVGGLVTTNPFQYSSVHSISFRGYVVHSKKLLSWSQITPLALCLGNSSQSQVLTSEVNKYRTLLHENVPWSTLEHIKLSEQLLLLRASNQTPEINSGTNPRVISKTIEFQSLVPLPPCAVVFWTELEFHSRNKFCTADEPLWRPAAILFGTEVPVSSNYRLSVCFSGSSLSASIIPV